MWQATLFYFASKFLDQVAPHKVLLIGDFLKKNIINMRIKIFCHTADLMSHRKLRLKFTIAFYMILCGFHQLAV